MLKELEVHKALREVKGTKVLRELKELRVHKGHKGDKDTKVL